jgi:hypothetical protein
VARYPQAANRDNRLPGAPLPRIECGNGLVERGDVADIGAEAPVADPLHDLAQLSSVGLHHEIDGAAAGRRRFHGSDDGDQGASSSDQRPLADLAADNVEHQINLPDIFEAIVLEVDEDLRAEAERLSRSLARPVPMT